LHFGAMTISPLTAPAASAASSIGMAKCSAATPGNSPACSAAWDIDFRRRRIITLDGQNRQAPLARHIIGNHDFASQHGAWPPFTMGAYLAFFRGTGNGSTAGPTAGAKDRRQRLRIKAKGDGARVVREPPVGAEGLKASSRSRSLAGARNQPQGLAIFTRRKGGRRFLRLVQYASVAQCFLRLDPLDRFCGRSSISPQRS
jgi:hypothetical protein